MPDAPLRRHVQASSHKVQMLKIMDKGKRTLVEPGIEFRLTVWCRAGSGWRARVISADAAEREFASHFELARYLAWPAAPVEPGPRVSVDQPAMQGRTPSPARHANDLAAGSRLTGKIQ